MDILRKAAFSDGLLDYAKVSEILRSDKTMTSREETATEVQDPSSSGKVLSDKKMEIYPDEMKIHLSNTESRYTEDEVSVDDKLLMHQEKFNQKL